MWQEHPWLVCKPEIIHPDKKSESKSDFQKKLLTLELAKIGTTVDISRLVYPTWHHYESFVDWCTARLKSASHITLAPRPVVRRYFFGDAKEAEEKIRPQEYTLVKLELADPPALVLSKINDDAPKIGAAVSAGLPMKIYLLAATMRPEGVYGQTNAFIAPEEKYGIYRFNSGSTGTFFISSWRAARNLTHQGVGASFIDHVLGAALVGCRVFAPRSKYEWVYVLPLASIDMRRGTGIVMSVPGDSPDDYLALRDFVTNPEKRVCPKMVDGVCGPFPPVPIIALPGHGALVAIKMCEERGIASWDLAAIAAIKSEIYLDSFYKGIMLVGEYAGRRVKDVKSLIAKSLCDASEAISYWDVNVETGESVGTHAGSRVDKKTGAGAGARVNEEKDEKEDDDYVVAMEEDWFLTYSRDSWRAAVVRHVNTNMQLLGTGAGKLLADAVMSLRDEKLDGRGCVLDSRISAAYCTIAHLVRDDFGGWWDSVFCGNDLKIKLRRENVAEMRDEFEYWYPVDLQVTDRASLSSHGAASLFQHAAIWPDVEVKGVETNKWPRSMSVSGSVKINGRPAVGRDALMMHTAINRWSADGVRAAIAEAGDGASVVDFSTRAAENFAVRLDEVRDWIGRQSKVDMRKGGPETYTFYDRVMENGINEALLGAFKAYETMQFRLVIKIVWTDYCMLKDNYCVMSKPTLHAEVIQRWIYCLLVMLSPIAPHWCQSVWASIGELGEVADVEWPVAGEVDAFVNHCNLVFSGRKYNTKETGLPPVPKIADRTILARVPWRDILAAP